MKKNLFFISVAFFITSSFVFSQNKLSGQNAFTHDPIASGANSNSRKIKKTHQYFFDNQQIKKENPVIMACDS